MCPIVYQGLDDRDRILGMEMNQENRYGHDFCSKAQKRVGCRLILLVAYGVWEASSHVRLMMGVTFALGNIGRRGGHSAQREQ